LDGDGGRGRIQRVLGKGLREGGLAVGAASPGEAAGCVGVSRLSKTHPFAKRDASFIGSRVR
jgi:hypothetical protein